MLGVISAYKREREAIERAYRESHSKSAPAPEEDAHAIVKHLNDLRDCAHTHFPGLNPIDPDTVNSPAKLWAYIMLGVSNQSP